LLSFTPNPSCKEIVDKMLKNISEIKSLKYSLKLVERSNKKYNNFSSSVKLIRKPRQLYLNANGIEVLYTEGKRDGDALVNPNSFPYINLYLDPNGSLMRQDQHHTINEIGFDYFGSVISANERRAAVKFDEYFKLEADELVNNRMCYKITINNNDFSFIDYTVQKGENLVSIARKLFVGEYMILQINKPRVDDYWDVKAGQVIKVPIAYAKNVIVYIDKQTFLPVGLRIYDNISLYEQYDYFSLLLNPKIEEAEFTKNYTGYGF
jgi:hypothetical protein